MLNDKTWSVNVRDDDERTALHWAAAKGRENVVRFALSQSGADANAADDEGWSPLISAASAGHAAVVQLLLAHGARPDQTTTAGRSAAHYAASKGHIAVLEALGRGGASLELAARDGSTPLHRAVGAGHESAVLFLLARAPASLAARLASTGDSPLHLAVQEQRDPLALLLVQHGADPTLPNRGGLSSADLASPPLRAQLLSAASSK